MDHGKISVRYARALLNYAVEQHCETAVYEELVRLCDNYSLAINAFNEALSNPLIDSDKKLQLLKNAIGEPVSPCLTRFLEYLTGKGRENKVFLIALKYQEMYRKSKNMLRVDVTTAAELDDKALQRIHDFVRQTFGCEVEMRVKVNPTLIGGFTLDIEHDRMDASIAGRLNKLKKELQL